MATDRVTLAHPWDVIRTFDPTTSNAQLDGNNFQNTGDDADYLKSLIEDAEAEFHQLTDSRLRIGRVGVPGQRATYEQATYKISGHKLTKGTFSGVWTEYLPQEGEIMLENENVIPFDAAAGDEVFIYRGLGGGSGLGDGGAWENVTEKQGDMWAILDHGQGRFVFSPVEIASYLVDSTGQINAGFPSFLRRLRFAISYRSGGLGGSRGRPTQTTLAASIDDQQTDTVAVDDGATFPGGAGGESAIAVLINDEYVLVEPDPANDQMRLVERGIRGTNPQAHDEGDRIQYTPPAIRKAVAARAGKELVQNSRFEQFLPDNEDDLNKNDIMGELQSTWDTTIQSLTGGE